MPNKVKALWAALRLAVWSATPWPLKKAWRAFREPALRRRGGYEDSRAKAARVTLLIKAFERPKAVERLIDSIDRYYGHFGDALTVMVADDSECPVHPGFPSRNKIVYMPMEFDVGLSAGRNAMVRDCQTEYFVLLDDDFVFTERTRLERFVEAMDANPAIGVMGGAILDKGWKLNDFFQCVDVSSGDFKLIRKDCGTLNGMTLYHVIPNFFIARTSDIKECLWRDELKISEHVVFYVDCLLKGIKISVLPEVLIEHYKMRSDFYRKFRSDRFDNYNKMAGKYVRSLTSEIREALK